jgi:hypothetical protein
VCTVSVVTQLSSGRSIEQTRPLQAQERPGRRQYRPTLLRGGTKRSDTGMIQD